MSTLGVKGRGHPPNVSSTSFNRAVCHTGYEFFISFILLYLSFYLHNLASVFDINSHWATSKSLGGKIMIGVKKRQTCLMVTSASDPTHTSTDHYAALEWPFNSFLTLSPSLFSARCSTLMRSDIFCLTLLQNPFPLFPPSAQAGLWEMKWRRVERLLGKGDRGLWSIIDSVTEDDGVFKGASVV